MLLLIALGATLVMLLQRKWKPAGIWLLVSIIIASFAFYVLNSWNSVMRKAYERSLTTQPSP